MSRLVTLGSRSFDLDRRPLLMGILNVTPDSFSDGGDYIDPELAVKRALQMEELGADIIDVGGESTRPGAAEVSVDEEIERVVPAIRAIRKSSEIPISIDTRKSTVLAAAHEAGADILNDISGLTYDASMPLILQQLRLPVIIMHMQGSPQTMQQNPVYEDVIGDIRTFLNNQAEVARAAGSPVIFVDPGIGFGKTLEHNLRILANAGEFGGPDTYLALGPSRKSFISMAIGVELEERLEGTLAAAAIGVANGADLVRLHDIREGRRAIDLAHLIRKAQ